MAQPPRRGWTDKHEALARAEGKPSWAAWIAEREQDLGRTICGARNKRDHPCGSPPKKGAARCRHHGGSALWGAAHPQWEGKGRGRYLPDRLLQKYREIDHDELQSMLEVQRVALAVHAELLERLGAGESSPKWEALRELSGDLAQGLAEGHVPTLERAASMVCEIVAEAPSMDEQLHAIREQEDHYRKLFDSQTRRARQEEEYMHRVAVMALMEELAKRALNVVSDLPDRRKAMASEVRGLLGSLGPGGPEPLQA